MSRYGFYMPVMINISGDKDVLQQLIPNAFNYKSHVETIEFLGKKFIWNRTTSSDDKCELNFLEVVSGKSRLNVPGS